MSIQYLYGAEIWTHNLNIASLIPYPLDQGSRPSCMFGQSTKSNMWR